MLRLATAVLLPALLVAYPTLWKTPIFSYDTVQVFAHVTNPTPFNKSDLAFLSKFQVVQFDKAQSRSLPGPQEQRFIAAAKQVKQYNPKTWTLMYLNGILNFPEFRLYNETKKNPQLLLHNAEGGLAHIHISGGRELTVFDLNNTAMRKTFVDDCMLGINSTWFDGCFIDRANWAQQILRRGEHPDHFTDKMLKQLSVGGVKLFADLQKAATQNHVILAKETNDIAGQDWKEANAMMLTDTFCSKYERDPRPYNHTQCALDIASLQAAAARGQLVECHAMGPHNSHKYFNFGLSAFLVGMGNLSYYSYQSWGKGAWSLSGIRWWGAYDKPLGAPLGLAERHGAQYTRKFSSGTSVWVDIKSRDFKITWGTKEPHV